MKSALLLITLTMLWIAARSETSFSGGADVVMPGCRSQCGNLTVPYPFGMGASCSIDPMFDIVCNESTSPPKAFLASGSIGGPVPILGITETKVRIKNRPARSCYNDTVADDDFAMNFSGTPFSFSNENKLMAVGCNTAAFALKNPLDFDTDSNDFITSCVAICSKLEDLSNGACSGLGCCQSSIPKGVIQSIYSAMTTLTSQNKTPDGSECGYTFLAEQNSYSFNATDITDPLFVQRTTENVPIVLDWVIGNRTCDEIKKSGEEAICDKNSVCVDSGKNLGGYRCNCLKGYEGNPYLSPGVLNIHSICRSVQELQLFLCFLWAAAEDANIIKNGCPSKCGELRVPYPFGIGINSGCSINPFFAINCDASFNPPKAFLSTYKLEVLGISYPMKTSSQ